MSPKIDAVTDEHGLVSMAQTIPGGAPITVKIVKDSITDGGSRLITWCCEYWRGIHEEVMTHRSLSRNSASSRAIPTSRMRAWVTERPFIPAHFGKNEKGMQASSEVDDVELARSWWLKGLDLMAAHHAEGERLGLHKQIVNRVIQPWMMIAVVVSATDHANLFHLRKHHMAEPHFQIMASLMWELFHNHMPTYVRPGDWHLPYVDGEGDLEAFDLVRAKKISTARCARVSYLTHEGKRDIAADIDLHDKLAATASMGADPMHASPFEHPAMAFGGRKRFGNFEGWVQYRKTFPNEAGPDTSERCGRCGCWGDRHVKGCPDASG